MASGPLSAEELESVTGYKRGAEQVEFFSQYGLTALLNRHGGCTMTWEALTEAMTRQAVPVGQPNWRAIQKRA